MTRAEHLQWCKDRAMEYVKSGDLPQAFSSFNSDMSKHSETQGHGGLEMGGMLLVNGNLNTAREMEEYILGFN